MEKEHFPASSLPAIGGRIRKERNKWNLTQEQLSEYLGISTNYLGQIERGRSFSHGLAERICSFFHITYDYLYYGEVPEAEPLSPEAQDQLERLIASCSPEEKRLCLSVLQEILAEIRSFRRNQDQVMSR